MKLIRIKILMILSCFAPIAYSQSGHSADNPGSKGIESAIPDSEAKALSPELRAALEKELDKTKFWEEVQLLYKDQGKDFCKALDHFVSTQLKQEDAKGAFAKQIKEAEADLEKKQSALDALSLELKKTKRQQNVSIGSTFTMAAILAISAAMTYSRQKAGRSSSMSDLGMFLGSIGVVFTTLTLVGYQEDINDILKKLDQAKRELQEAKDRLWAVRSSILKCRAMGG